MCFSAEASFGASAIILGIGIVAIKKSTNLPQKILSCIPLVFSVQQFAEGILWLSLSHPSLSKWNKIATYSFLVFAQVVWPILIPLSVMLLEKERKNKKILSAFLIFGIILSSVLSYCLLFYKAEASISCNHIRYDLYYPIHLKYSGIFYFIPTVIPPLISSVKRFRLFGIVIVLSYIISKIFYQYYLISVWCYFAAIISIIILFIIIKLNQEAKTIRGILPV